ncbi:MAG TPA: hypothetical protein PK413_21495, partial [Thermoanaerobaculia bacterium]|nr:hypothetical protein [Thermoanaerobaculia bacterium]
VLETGRVYEQMCQRQLAQLHALRRELAPYLPPAEVQQALREAAVPCYLLSLYDGLELLAGPAGVMAVAASARQLASITPENPQGNRQDPLELWHELDPLCPLPRLTAGTPG